MATTNTGRGFITIVDMNDNRTLSFGISSNQATTQIVDPNNNLYAPDYTTTNLVLTPFLYYSGGSTDQISQCTNITWTINGGSTSGWGTVASTNPCALTINHNLANVSQLLVVCTANFVDPDTSVSTTVKSSITISKLSSAGDNINCILTFPGSSIFYNDSVASIQIQASMYVGTTLDTTNINYEWYQLMNGSWTKLTSSNHGTIANYTNRTITIYPDDVLNFEQFKCKVKDTDTASGTYNQTAESMPVIVYDLSDPYAIEIYSSTGNILTAGASSTTLRADVTRGGIIISDQDSLYTNATFTWQKYLKNGNLDTSWGTNGVKTGRTQTVLRDEIDVKSMFICTLTLS